MVHVSTAYSNANRESISETIYPTSKDPDEIIELCESESEEQIRHLTAKIIGTQPNTYTFTKALTERMIELHGGSLPIAIVRPSIVIACLKEPLAGWIDNLYGPTGIIVASGKGLIRSIFSPLYFSSQFK